MNKEAICKSAFFGSDSGQSLCELLRYEPLKKIQASRLHILCARHSLHMNRCTQLMKIEVKLNKSPCCLQDRDCVFNYWSPSPTTPFLKPSNLRTRGHHMSYIPCTELPFPTDPGPASVAAAPTLDVFSQRKKKKLIRARRFRSTKKSAKPHYLVVNLNRGLGLASHSQCRCTTR